MPTGSTIAQTTGNKLFGGGAFIINPANATGGGPLSWATGTGQFLPLATANYTNSATTALSTTTKTQDVDVATDASAGGNNSATTVLANTLRFNAAGTSTVTATGLVTLTTGGILVTPTVGINTASITGGYLTAANANFALFNQFTTEADSGYATTGGQIIVHQYNTSSAFTIGSIIENNPTAPTPGTLSTITAQATGSTAPAYANGTLRLFTLSSGSTATLSPGMSVTVSGTINGALGTVTGTIIDTESATAFDVYLPTNPTIAAGATATYSPNTAFTKSGPGDVVLSAANTYSGITYIDQGALRLQNDSALPSASPLFFAGGVLGLGDSGGPTTAFTRSLGSAAGQVNFVGNGGFAAYGSSATADTVNIGGAGASLNWGYGLASNGTGFLADGMSLLFGAASSTSTVNFTNGINLNQGVRTISVTNGVNSSATTPDAEITGVIADGTGSGSLVKEGNGVLELDGANTYTGATTISGGTLTNNGSLTSAVMINSGTTYAGSGSTTSSVTEAADGHIAPGSSTGAIDTLKSGALTLNGGSLDYDFGPDAASTHLLPGSSDSFAATVTGGDGTVTFSGTTTLNASSLTDIGAGSYELISYADSTSGFSSTSGTISGTDPQLASMPGS